MQNLFYKLHNENSYEFLKEIPRASIHSIITDPPYGINFKNCKWDYEYPPTVFWTECYDLLYEGGYLLAFSSVKGQHYATTAIENAGFEILDILLWVYLNGMPKIGGIGLAIDKELNTKSISKGEYKYKCGYATNSQDTFKISKNKHTPASDIGKLYEDTGYTLKPAYEPIILARKPIRGSVISNILATGVGCLNFSETRIPLLDINEKVAGQNPNIKGRIPSNIIRTDFLEDGYDKFFYIKKCREERVHPTQKPFSLMNHLVNLVTYPSQVVLDPFMGSGTTGKACLMSERSFIGIERETEYFNHAYKAFLEKI